ncbi:MAG: hypothetical protein HN742_02985 [Lentisphaerae bacterium]|jgi:hypothetical protein|nr:hypothetical protein [Lentisphaerota bacterium]MBT4814919.1 hypothetical protein [Lentisphaerota bacterium]MBT5605434.1 hypothetical protein [Lentisphaerota bacterium]MBT7060135.1 hypothetical protein [Lentisphaerota bacterium]MBT7840805.1 hypothetical protein [Lentisphaerota bacterium]
MNRTFHHQAELVPPHGITFHHQRDHVTQPAGFALEEPVLRNRPVLPASTRTVLLTMTASFLALCAVQGAGTPPSMEAFGIIVDRNVFDPGRSRPGPPVKAPLPPPAPEPVKQRDHLHLTGILLGEDAIIGFVSSSRAEWTGAFTLAQGQEIGPGRIGIADTGGVTLIIGDAIMDWPVGTQLEEADDGWRSTEGRATLTAPKATPSLTDPPSNASSEAPAANDVLKRLMERRRKESK